MKSNIEDLYDYSVLRSIDEATMFIVDTSQPVAVLGSGQSLDIVDVERLGDLELRRRRGGGGLVLLRPGNLWIDWWVPASDPRWSFDVRAMSVMVGTWWQEALRREVRGVVEVHDGPLQGDIDARVVCFAGRGPGEVFVDGRKAVGLTQWRVREGAFLSSLLPSGDSLPLLSILKFAPKELLGAIGHHDLASLEIDDPSAVIGSLQSLSGNWRVRTLFLNP